MVHVSPRYSIGLTHLDYGAEMTDSHYWWAVVDTWVMSLPRPHRDPYGTATLERRKITEISKSSLNGGQYIKSYDAIRYLFSLTNLSLLLYNPPEKD